MTVSRKQLSRWLDQWQELLQLQAWAVSLAGRCALYRAS